MAEHDVPDKDKLLDHDYDGIRELDNLLPRWWLWIFYLTTAFSVLYIAYYHIFHIGYLQQDEYRKEMNPNFVRAESRNPIEQLNEKGYHPPWYSPKRDEARKAMMAGQAAPQAMAAEPEPTIEFTDPLTDADSLAKGKALFMKYCTQCHLDQGQGKIGPNLTDNYWIHGNLYKDSVQVVANGVLEKGMPVWRKQLSPDQIHEVTSYIYTLRGTNPPDPKAPEGKEY